LKPEQVRIHNAFLGGGFGRRDANDEIAQAIAIAKVVKRPVKLIWTREEDTRQDRFRPHAVVGFKAAAGADGMPTAMVDACRNLVDLQDVGIRFRPIGPSRPPSTACESNGYDVPNTRVEVLLKDTHLPVWFYRAPGGQPACLCPRKLPATRLRRRAVSTLPHAAASFLKGKPELAQGVGYRPTREG